MWKVGSSALGLRTISRKVRDLYPGAEIVISYSPGPRRFSTYLPSLSEARERWTPLSTFLISITAPAIGAPFLFDTEPWNDPVVSFWAGAWPASARLVT